MSGSQHNPNGRQSQLGSGWSPLQVLQMANLLARAPQAHMASDRGVTWHTPTPPPHLYHVPAPSPPDPLQAMKSAGSNSVFRHTATPPELFRHTPTPPEKHMMRHTPSPGDVKSGPPMPPVDMYPHLGPGRDKLVRAEDLLAYARVGVDLSLGSRANGAPVGPPPSGGPAQPPPAHSPALSVRDAPTINSLVGRGGSRRVDALLERLAAPPSPHSVIVHPRALPSPSPPSSNEDSADSCGAVPGSKRKRKPERTVRVPAPPAPAPPLAAPAPGLAPPPPPTHLPTAHPLSITAVASSTLVGPPRISPAPTENGDVSHSELHGPPDDLHESQNDIHESHNELHGPHHEPDELHGPQHGPDELHGPQHGPDDLHEPQHASDELHGLQHGHEPHTVQPEQPEPAKPEQITNEPESTRRKTRSGSAETIADIAAMIALGGTGAEAEERGHTPPPPALSVDKLKSVLASPEPQPPPPAPLAASPHTDTRERTPGCGSAAAPRRGGAGAAAAGAPLPSPSEGKPAEGEPAPAASFVEVENQLEKMFAHLEEQPHPRPRPTSATDATANKESAPANKRRKSAPGRGREAPARRKGPRSKVEAKPRRKHARDLGGGGYDSGSNASSGRSRGPYIQIRSGASAGAGACVTVMNAATGEEEEGGARRRGGERRRGLHASTLGLRYDAATRDPSWLCAFCLRGPHHAALGDLFGPYALEEGGDAWVHAPCALWAPGVVAAGARVWGLPAALAAARPERCRHCARAAAPLACAARACPARAHLPCAQHALWALDEERFRALCPAHHHL